MVRFIGILLLFLLCGAARGQESDSLYSALLDEEQTLRAREDSLLGVIRSQRALLVADTTDRRARSLTILSLEERVFGVRNQLGILASRINAIEQERILSDLLRPATAASTTTPSEPATDEPNLIENAWFRENLSPDEYRQLTSLVARQGQIEERIIDYVADYQELDRVVETYALAQVQPVADSLYGQYRRLTARIRQTESDFKALWGERYNEEIYLYSYLLDKLNQTADLAALNEKNRAREVFDDEKTMSAAFADYPGQRALLTDYELALADALHLASAADSIRRAAAPVNDLDFPRLELVEKEFVEYADIAFPDASPYTAENPIPELEIPASGTFYSVTVGAFSRQQPVSTFRGAAPVAWRREGTQWRYFVGLFRAYGDALAGVEQLRGAGFRTPEAVRWVDGAYTALGKESAENQGLFRIEIPTGGDLPDEVREALNRYAHGKEITRVGGTFYVGTFTDRIHLDEVLAALRRIGIEGIVVNG